MREFIRDARTRQSKVEQKRIVRARVYEVLSTVLVCDAHGKDPSWVDELVVEGGIDRDLAYKEIGRVWLHLKKLG